MKSKRWKSLAANITLTVVTVILLIIGSEIGLRVFEDPAFVRHNRLFVQYDPLMGWVKIPGMQARHTTIEYDIHESFNSKGIRGPEIQYAKDPEEYRVLFLGDSFAEGYSVEFDELCSEVVRRNLADRGDRKYTVINAGTGGYSTDQEYLFFESEGRRYQPDVTVLLFCANDISGNSLKTQYRGQKPLFKLAGGNLVLTNVPVPKPRPDTAFENEHDDSTFDRAKQWLFGHSYLYVRTRNAVVTNPWLYRLLIKHGLAEAPPYVYGENMLPEEFRYWSRTRDSVSQQAWEITEALLVHLNAAATSASSKLLVYYIPISGAVYDDQWQSTRDQYDLSDDAWSIHQVGLDLAAVCKRNGIDFIDPTARFIKEAPLLEKQNKRLYFPHDRHWTAEGQRLCGNMITEYITEKLAAGSAAKTARTDTKGSASF